MLEFNFAEMSAKDGAAAARNLGLKTFNGPPCRSCGGTERYASNSVCVPCVAKSNKKILADDEKYIDYRVSVFIKNERDKGNIPKSMLEDDAFMRTFREEVRRLYVLKKILEHLTGHEWEIDHIVATFARGDWWGNYAGEQVCCGLHVPWNLWLLPKRLNRLKSATFHEPMSVPGCVLSFPTFSTCDIAVESDAERVAILANVEQYLSQYYSERNK